MKYCEISINFVKTKGACVDFYWLLVFASQATH
jgi:hypothetical protein